MTVKALSYCLLHNDVLANQFKAILNLSALFPNLIAGSAWQKESSGNWLKESGGSWDKENQ